ncbi:MAG: phosphate ABC transporter permease PstA [Thiomonas sp.]|jgi:phosphate transport system permease protein|uniref:phosphate ABC transporter permease PstA n=1 Tax=Thiomonas TaxID=32012 RepID=UPI00238AA731|nr:MULTISPECIES: phosphate ABC transporter permease PstA [Thiomonas]MDE2175077.1 phosphate ABC transporter permease PstA [Betaproteobacteria bacterium]MDE2268354.1 phosphate ABC transporter permease PstA [Betaproteobacteria bacterium]HML81485.1 phosphate ABC transporter permease PstA [Thiomonas arsenitoxydans]
MSATTLPQTPRSDFRQRFFGRRKMTNIVVLTLSLAAMAFGMIWLLWILYSVLQLGIGGLSLATFTEMTPPPMTDGGLLNAIYGSVAMTLVGTLLGTPLGIMAGVYLSEYGANGWLAKVTRFINDILLAAPSIIIGLFVYALIVANTKTFSGWAGSIALALLVVPVVVRTTEDMLRLVPGSLREAAYALGTPKWKVISAVILRAARAGVLTGIMLAVARITGETAPLLFTALNNQFFNAGLSQPMANLPVTIYNYAMSPYSNWQSLAWAGVLIITFGVLVINVTARILIRQKH